MISTPESSIRRSGGFAPLRVGGEKAIGKTPERERLLPPERRGFAAIPAPEVLEALIARAVEALKAGIFWDRGSILNLVI